MRLNAHLNTSSPKECPPKFCGNGGKCHIEKGKPVCECLEEFTGPRCELPVTKNVCIPNPCLNGGECQNNGNAASCFCTDSFTGKYCEIACGCESNQICRESFKTPGSAECLTVPPSELLTPENGSSEITTTTMRIVSETTTPFKPTDFPLPPFLANNSTDLNPQNDVSYATTMIPNNLTTVPYIETLPDDYDDLLNVTSCEECVNAQRCVNIDKRTT
uniref:EGF-like domain-containing protein n=1 Tax=Panagrolaimus sp. JU765 TaxID=591449 RepID=A0AC34R5N1_9BILA